jgi:hypothetical protein
MKIITALLGIATISFFLVFVTSSVKAEPQTDTKLIIRGDDMGMTQGSLVAFEKAFNEGVLTCASIQVPAPWFEGHSYRRMEGLSLAPCADLGQGEIHRR